MLARLLIIVPLLAVSAAAAPCSYIRANAEAWTAARTDAFVAAARRAFQDDRKLPSYERDLDLIAAYIDRCGLDKDAAYYGRFRRFVDYIKTVDLVRLDGHDLGFNVPDRQYFAETATYVEVPDYLLNPDFLHVVTRAETLSRAKEYLRKLNETRPADKQLIFFSYRSRHLGTPDNDVSFLRLLIVVPGDASRGIAEKWVQFGVTDPGAKVRIRNLSVVAVVPAADGKADTYFKDYFRTYRAGGTIAIKGRSELGYGDDNCAECHKSGILPIFPAKGSVARDELPNVDKVNERFLSYGPPRFGKYLDMDALGPGIGFAGKKDRAARFGLAFAATTVGRAMTCNTCHTPERLGYLNWPMDQVILDSYITGGQMPQGGQVSAAERLELYNKLVEEYFSTDARRPGILRSWLISPDTSDFVRSTGF